MQPSPDEPESIAPGARRWTPRAAARRGIEVLKDEGVRSLVARALGETVYRRLLLFEREVGTLRPATETASGLEFGWLKETRLAEYERFRPGRGSQAAARLRAGDRCFAAWLDGELVAVRWVAIGSAHVEYLDLRLPLAPGEVYHYDSFTSPKHRRRGLSTAGRARLDEALREEGVERVVHAVLPENRAALAEFAKAGSRLVGRIGYVRLGPWRHEFRRRFS